MSNATLQDTTDDTEPAVLVDDEGNEISPKVATFFLLRWGKSAGRAIRDNLTPSKMVKFSGSLLQWIVAFGCVAAVAYGGWYLLSLLFLANQTAFWVVVAMIGLWVARSILGRVAHAVVA